MRAASAAGENPTRSRQTEKTKQGKERKTSQERISKLIRRIRKLYRRTDLGRRIDPGRRRMDPERRRLDPGSLGWGPPDKVCCKGKTATTSPWGRL